MGFSNTFSHHSSSISISIPQIWIEQINLNISLTSKVSGRLIKIFKPILLYFSISKILLKNHIMSMIDFMYKNTKLLYWISHYIKYLFFKLPEKIYPHYRVSVNFFFEWLHYLNLQTSTYFYEWKWFFFLFIIFLFLANGLINVCMINNILQKGGGIPKY